MGDSEGLSIDDADFDVERDALADCITDIERDADSDGATLGLVLMVR